MSRINKDELSTRQMQIMDIIWDSKGPITASAIVDKSSVLRINSVQAGLRSLLSRNLVKVGDIVYSGTVLARSYVPVMSRQEYMSKTCTKLSDLGDTFNVVAKIIAAETDPEELKKMEKMIQDRREQLKCQ